MDTDIQQTTDTDMDSKVDDYSVSSAALDEATLKETKWQNQDFDEYLGYYKKIPELRQAILALATWTAGKGYTSELSRNKTILENITGWGEDSFQSILENMMVVKKVNGDAYAEIIRNDSGTLINLKPLNPKRMRTIANSKGKIIRYEEFDPASKEKQAIRTFEPKDIFHLVNNRTANEIHGISVVESVKWVIEARNEAMRDWRRISHRSTIRVMYIDADEEDKLDSLKKEYAEAIDEGELLILPAKKGEAGFEELSLPPHRAFLEWIQYLENFFYQAVGVPKVILGGSQEYAEAGAKVGYLTFEQVYMKEQRELENDIWNQLAIRIKFERPVSLKEPVVESEEANTGQMGFQPNETDVRETRTE